MENDIQELNVQEPVLSYNDKLAKANRQTFMSHGIFVINMLASPGAGKTSFLERTLQDISGEFRIGIIVGDLKTDNDARRMQGKGARVYQIQTENVCHLDAEMVSHALEHFDMNDLDVMFIENVGNLVCPASFDLGESCRVVLHSVPEGEDKPLKYPTMFKTADIAIISKMDIADAVGFQRDIALQNIHQIAPQAKIMEVSSRTGLGMETWYEFLRQRYIHNKSN
jgi:hydrogenase nickel incorporation protein HypB